MDKLRCALIQMDVENSKEENIAKSEIMIKKAVSKGAKLIVLPEMFNCPYQASNFPKYAEKEGDYTWKRLSAIAMALGLKREAVGATVSICREPTLGVIGEKYGLNSPEGTGVLGTYMVGNIFGTIFFGLLGSFGVLTGLHPYALAMASGMGRGV